MEWRFEEQLQDMDEAEHRHLYAIRNRSAALVRDVLIVGLLATEVCDVALNHMQVQLARKRACIPLGPSTTTRRSGATPRQGAWPDWRPWPTRHR
jgi:hypothetical protein